MAQQLAEITKLKQQVDEMSRCRQLALFNQMERQIESLEKANHKLERKFRK